MGNKNKNCLQDECIRVPKVYDWVTDAVKTPVKLFFSDRQLEEIEAALADPSRRPLRVIIKTPKLSPLLPLEGRDSDSKHAEQADFFCEKVGEKRHVTVSVGGSFVKAELVDLLFTANIQVLVVDRFGEIVTKTKTDVSALESFVLCYPDGTELFCKVSKIWARLSNGSLILNGPFPRSIHFDVTFCVDVQVEAEVKLEVLAKFCDPRPNDIKASEKSAEQCPTFEFPKQCPDIFPGKSCEGKAHAHASGETCDDATEKGIAGILADICPNGSILNSKFEFTFEDRDTSDGLNDFTFKAKSFDIDTLESYEKDGYAILKVSGEGRTDKGHHLDFNLDLAARGDDSKFRVQLIDERSGKLRFDTDIVEVAEGTIDVESCELQG